jgi:hypothetical protein
VVNQLVSRQAKHLKGLILGNELAFDAESLDCTIVTELITKASISVAVSFLDEVATDTFVSLLYR